MDFDNRVELLHSILCLSENLKIKKNKNNFYKKEEKGGKNCRKSLGMTSSRETSLYI